MLPDVDIKVAKQSFGTAAVDLTGKKTETELKDAVYSTAALSNLVVDSLVDIIPVTMLSTLFLSTSVNIVANNGSVVSVVDALLMFNQRNRRSKVALREQLTKSNWISLNQQVLEMYLGAHILLTIKLILILLFRKPIK
jgi:hypothetical protein